MNGQPIDVIGRDKIVTGGGPRRAARRPRQQRRDPLADRARRRRGAGLAPGRAGGPGAGLRRLRARRRRRLRLGARPRRGHDAHRGARDGPPRGARPRPHGHAAARPEATPAEQDELLAEVLENALEAAKEAVERGPEQLAGAARGRRGGRGRLRADGDRGRLPGRAARRRPLRRSSTSMRPSARCTCPSTSPRASATAPTSPSPGEGLDAGAFVPLLEELGDSVLVVGDERTLRVHVHTDEPERAVALFEAVGEVSRFDVADMREQVADRDARLGGGGERGAQATCGVVAVASGEGLRRLFEELGAHVVDGGPTMNPSTYELLAGIHARPAAEVLVLPNSPNVILAAERAAELSEKPAGVVPTTAPQEGLAALLAFDPGQGRRERRRRRRRRLRAAPGRCGPGRPRRRAGPLHRRRRRGLRRRRAGGLGRSRGRDARRDARPHRRRRGAAHLHRGRGAAARPRRRGGARSRRASSSSTTRAGSRRGGGCSARNDVLLRSFASTQELTPEERVRRAARSSSRARPAGAAAELPRQAGRALEPLGIATHGDLIEHLPHSHRDRRDARTIASVGVGEEATVAVTVRSVTVRPMRDRRRKRVEARVADETGPMVAVWFNQPWLARQLSEGTQVLLHGKLRRRNEFWVKEFEELGGTGGAAVPHRGPGAGAPGHRGHHRRAGCASWSGTALPLIRHVVEPLPAALRVAERLADRPAALAGAHFPDTEDEEAGARRRLAFEELFLLQLAVAGRRRARREGRRAPRWRRARRPGGPLALVAAVPADRRPGGRLRRDRRRPRLRAADAAAADGGGGQRQDRRSRCTRCCAPSRTAARRR